jgi:acetyl-CoA acetyltransferase family protein
MLMPLPPSPKEPSTGLTMGQHCEMSAKEFAIARQLQDQIALRSHQNAQRARDAGLLRQEIAPLAGVEHDNLVRGDTSIEKLAKLKPVFDRSEGGTLTAGNSSALTDGASIVCLMSEAEARRQNREVLGFVERIQFSALDPSMGLLMAPGVALPKLMHEGNLTIGNVDRFEVHEAFAAQVAANMKIWQQGWDKVPSIRPIGQIPEEKLNVNGGSIALGHPFAATGGRLILSLVNELQRNKLRQGVISVCAAGGMACAMQITRE